MCPFLSQVGEAQERRSSLLCSVLSVHKEICHFKITVHTVENDHKFWCTQFSPWEGKISYFPNIGGNKFSENVTMQPEAGV